MPMSREVNEAERALRACLTTLAGAKGELVGLQQDLARVQAAIVAQEERIQGAERAATDAREYLTRIQQAESFESQQAAAQERLAAARREAADRERQTREALAHAQQAHLAATDALAVSLTETGDQQQ